MSDTTSQSLASSSYDAMIASGATKASSGIQSTLTSIVDVYGAFTSLEGAFAELTTLYANWMKEMSDAENEHQSYTADQIAAIPPDDGKNTQTDRNNQTELNNLQTQYQQDATTFQTLNTQLSTMMQAVQDVVSAIANALKTILDNAQPLLNLNSSTSNMM